MLFLFEFPHELNECTHCHIAQSCHRGWKARLSVSQLTVTLPNTMGTAMAQKADKLTAECEQGKVNIWLSLLST